MPMLDGWTEVLAAPGTRTTGTSARDFAIVGPNWKGKLPKGVKALRSETDMVWLLGRTYCDGTPEDYAAVHAIQDQYTLTPLSSYGKPYTPPEGIVDATIDMETPVREQVNNMSGIMFFTRFAELLKNNAPDRLDAPMIKKLAKLGIVPGKSLNVATLDPIITKAFDVAPRNAQQKILAQEKDAGTTKNGWIFSTKTGSYGTDYLQRALVAWLGLGANLPEDAIYPISLVDATNSHLNGNNRYVLHFAKNQIPPVRGFWSLTMYNNQYFFINNALNRYTLSQRDKLQFNPDGSLDLYIQKDSPGIDKETNWLPAPSGDFALMLRLYWPKESVLNGKWDLPGVAKV
jgi:DNA sulfur modification protein DndE